MTVTTNRLIDSNGGNVESYDDFRLHKSFNYKNYVWGWSWLFALGIAVATGFLAYATTDTILYYSLRAKGIAISDYDVRFAIRSGFVMAAVGFGIAFAIGLKDRVEKFDALTEKQRSRLTFAKQGPIETRPAGREVVLVNGQRVMSKVRPAKTLAFGGTQFTFTGVNLDAMMAWTRSGDYSVRKVSGGGRIGFDALPEPITSSAYTDALFVLRKHNYLSEYGKGYKWTDQGIAWLKAE